ncbi:hypothetical protein [Dyella humicola]|uniref:hypothetical protein n=1 Tax=Dyella humicola TaxID=2992126 RepID=UPI0022546208|nr:hypothetical protein [Dyella humicola]
MSRRFHPSRRRRILWIGTVLFCLLFQQLAMASYVCTLPAVPVDAALTGECAAMGMASKAPSASKHVHSSPDPRCTEHCSSHVTSRPDARVPTVPPLLLPPASPMLAGTIVHAPEQVPLPDFALRRPEPPPTLRFCSLLI